MALASAVVEMWPRPRSDPLPGGRSAVGSVAAPGWRPALVHAEPLSVATGVPCSRRVFAAPHANRGASWGHREAKGGFLRGDPAKRRGSCALPSLSELLRSHWYLYWGHIAYKQEAYSLSGENFFMSETENSCSRLCHPFFSRQKIPKSCNQRSLHLIDKVTNKPKCLSMSTAVCQTSSIATRCPV